MNARTVAPALSRRTHLVVMIATAALLSAASFQSAWAQTAPTLGTAKSFAVLGGSTVTNTGPSTIYGDLGVSPGSAVTGFPPGQVIAPGTIHAADAVAGQAQSDLTTAYNTLAGEASTSNETGQDLGGQTLVKGVYSFTSSAQLTGDLTLNAKGNANAVFIFQIGSTLTTASNASVKLINGAQPCNVFWQVGSSATLGTDTSFIGNILALTSITVTTGAGINGRALARNGAVTLDNNNISFSGCGSGTTSGADNGPIAGSGPGNTGTPGTPPVAGLGPVCTSVTPPRVTLTREIWGPPTTWFITVRDANSGLASIIVTLATNVTPGIPVFTPGTTAPIVVTATSNVMIDSATEAPTAFGIQVTDLCGNVTLWDPVQFTITSSETVTVGGISRTEHFVTIENEGLQALIVSVNGRYDQTVWFGQQTTRTINIGKVMVPGDDDTITFEAVGFGGRNGRAVVFVHPK